MKKIICCLVVILTTACQRAIIPYSGDQTITGNGGFVLTRIHASNIGNSIFTNRPKYKYNDVTFYKSGLPYNKKCTLIASSLDEMIFPFFSSLYPVARQVLELGANTVTQSTICLPISFDKNAGFLDRCESLHPQQNNFYIFDCQ